MVSQGWATYTIHDQMLQDLDVVRSQLSVSYAPVEWKDEYLNWTLEDSYGKARQRIEKERPSTSLDYQKILKEFLGSLQDYHVRLSFYSTAYSFFPIHVKKAEDRYYFRGLSSITLSSEETQLLNITRADEEMINENAEDFHIGDEILEFNSRPIQEVVEELIDENFNGDRSPTGYELAVRGLFLRKASYGQTVLSGSFTLTCKSSQTGQISTRTFPWLCAPELVANHYLRDRQAPMMSKSAEHTVNSFSQEISSLVSKNYSVALAEEFNWRDISDIVGNQAAIETKDSRVKGFLPPLGKILWQTPPNSSKFYAYLYQDPVTNKTFGYIYLPTFHVNKTAADLYIQEMKRALQIFHRNADALVVDITDNTGGDQMFMYAVLSLLTNTFLQLPTEKEILTQEKIMQQAMMYYTLGDYQPNNPAPSQTVNGYFYTQKLHNQFKDHAQAILDCWDAGDVYTPPLHSMGMSEVDPHPQFNFTKPLLVLVNSFCFSCADFFPAILQDNQRAVIFGEKTAGAGGYVLPYSHSSRFGVKSYSLTGSIAYRQNGMPIENLGVTPDIPYALTERDMLENYTDYISHVNSALNELI